MHRSLLLPALLLLCACQSQDVPPTPAPPAAPVVDANAQRQAMWAEAAVLVLSTGEQGFHPDMDLAALVARFGAANVRAENVPLGEGDSEAGAVIFPDDPSRRAYLYFAEPERLKRLSAAYIRDPESRWQTAQGVRMGTDSNEVERINGGIFRLLGFDWDYGGYVSDWAQGQLAGAFGSSARLALRFDPPVLPEGVERPKDYPSGDAEFPSDHPGLRAQPARVIEIGMAFVP